MAKKLFVFVGEGVAGEAAAKRPGARHTLLIFVPASNLTVAQIAAAAKAEERGWLFVELRRGKEVPEDVNDISDDVLRDAAQSACDIGFGMVIYKDEIVPNS